MVGGSRGVYKDRQCLFITHSNAVNPSILIHAFSHQTMNIHREFSIDHQVCTVWIQGQRKNGIDLNTVTARDWYMVDGNVKVLRLHH